MNSSSAYKLLGLVLALALTDVDAKEENFGTATPSEQRVIEIFRRDSADPSASPADDGVKTRGINMIDTGKAKPKRKPVTPVLKEQAISLEVLFDYNSATLTEQAKQQLQPLGQALASDALKGLQYRIEGHTDTIGSDEFNFDLSRRRAEQVKAYLVEQFGLGDVAIQTEGKGKSNLADKFNPTSAVNRRVRIVRLGD